MADINYKKLFTVQLLHEYYLTDKNNTSLFDSNLSNDDYLLEMFGLDVPSVSKNFVYEVPDMMPNIFQNYQLRIVPEYAGFSVMARVTQTTLPDQTKAYKPFVKLPDDLNIIIQLTATNQLINAVTNRRINKAIPTAYYFTNEDLDTAKVFPELTGMVPDHDESYSYEQGELFMDSGSIKLFYFNGTTAASLPVNGSSYASSTDEIIAPLQFVYKFDDSDIVTSAVFTLNDHAGVTVRTFKIANNQPFRNVQLNFTHDQSTKNGVPEASIQVLPGSANTQENAYTLNVVVNNDKSYSHKLMFYEYRTSVPWALISIKPVVANEEFCLYDTDGFIRYRKNPDGSVVSAPVYEVRVKSRNTFWRYINDENKKLDPRGTQLAIDFLQAEGNNLITKKPRDISFLATSFGADKYLPNPENDGRIKIENGKFYSDIAVSRSTTFPLDTS
ncbi:hypothetical protein QEG73_05125 [Chitinophagaceae bacterium 26-R-25]|nr:hypothetical protein [Chitinophagaceae bacterium 26-R-25]